MAYAFSKLDDYFRRGKTGQATGSLEKGAATGAPPPTVQAQNLAKTAETSAEQGNAGAAGAYRAAKSADTSGIQSRLSQPAEQQAKNWTTEAEKQAGEYTATSQQRMGDTYKGFEAGNVAKAEAGESGATSALQQGLGYTGSELSFQPFQLEAPKLDTSSMLAGGVGGVQAALQKKGGRYTPGMAALDASVLTGNKQALAGLQGKLGGIQQTAREKKTALEGTDEAMAAQAKGRADAIREATKAALQTRMGALKEAQQTSLRGQLTSPEALQAQREGMTSQNQQMLNQLFGMYGLTPDQVYGAGVQRLDPASFLNLKSQNVSVGASPGQTNLYNLLGDKAYAPQTLTGTRSYYERADMAPAVTQAVAQWNQIQAQQQAAQQLAAQQAAAAQAAQEAQSTQSSYGDYSDNGGDDYSSSDYSYSGDTSGGGYTDFGPDYDYNAAYGDTY